MRPADPRRGVWPTPLELYAPLNERHRFDLDAAADSANTLCARYLSEADNALTQDWRARCFWLNPPYGMKPSTDVWVAYARRQVELGFAESGCLLVPVKAETAWWQDLVWGWNRVIDSCKVTTGPLAGRWYRLEEPRFHVEVLELRGRVEFGNDGTGFFASALVFFNPPARPALLLGGAS